MNTLGRSIWVGGTIFLACGIANARPDLNAFLNFHATTTNELLHQVRADSEVRDRYCRHFGMTPTQVYNYLGAMHPTVLGDTRTFTVYSVPVDGHLKMHLQTLKRGTPIFADRTGAPTLIVKCGNPLTLGPLRVMSSNMAKIEPDVPEPMLKDRLPDTDALASDTDSDSKTLLAMEPQAPDAPMSEASPAIAETTSEAASSEGGSAQTIVPGLAGTGSASAGIGTLGAVGALSGLTGIALKSINSTHPSPPPVPEPLPFVAFGLGGATILIRRNIRRKK